MSSIKLTILSVFFIVFAFSLFVVIASSSLVTENCTYIKCMKNNDDVTCYCSQINSSDGHYAGDNGINSGVTDSAYVFSYQNSTQIPLGSRIDNVTVCVEWKVSNIGACQIFLNNGTNVLLSGDCHTTKALYCYDGTRHVNDASAANNLGVNITESYAGNLYVDWVYVNISYEKFIKTDYWNLTNYTNGFVFTDGANLTRDDIINSSAHWNLTSSLYHAYLEHNGTGTPTNYSISDPYTENWTNYTLNLSDVGEFPEAGLIDLKAYAVEIYGWENVTTSHWFYLWGMASIDNIQLSDSLVYNGTSTRINCRVIDSNSSLRIEGYNVSFYNETSYLGSNLTNSSGWAFWHYRDNTKNPPGSYNLTCNITDQPDLFYNASSENSRDITLEVVGLTINANTSTKEVQFGENVTITANVSTDGSEPDSVWANITYINISDGKLVQGEETINLDLID
ncbi:MAG: hypothetical protein J7L08_01600, partial [Candidatus Aenigmarchaeota archaeon]|nr:hypothetical protein [Candidatus Aenigmarchaeota archaeon]